MSRREDASAVDAAERLAEERRDRYELIYTRLEEGATILVTEHFGTIGEGSDALRRLGPENDGDLAELSWNPKRAKWDRRSMSGPADLRGEEKAAMQARGFAAVRAVTAHHGGFDTRGGGEAALDARGHDHKPGRECPICSRGNAEHANPSDCTTCDYLIQAGIAPMHPKVSHPGPVIVRDRF